VISGVSRPVAPGDLLIADLNREQHGNIGPPMGVQYGQRKIEIGSF